MTVAAPKVNFINSRYFAPLKESETPVPFLTLRLKPGASDADKRELEEYVNHGLKFSLHSYLKKLKIRDPYWTWDGRLIDRSDLPEDYPYCKGWRGIWEEYHKQLSRIKIPET